MRPGTVAVALILILATAGLAYLGGLSNARTTTVGSMTTLTTVTTESAVSTTTESAVSTTTFSRTITLSTATSPSLEMFLDVYPRYITSGDNVSVNMALYNPLSINYTITVAVWNVGVCPGSFPFGFDIYQGHYDFSNLSSAVPLDLYNYTIPFPCFVGFNSTLDFGPHSEGAVDSNFLGREYHQVNYTMLFSGYYVPVNKTGGIVYELRGFQPGMYTVRLYDQWDQTQLAYFLVV